MPATSKATAPTPMADISEQQWLQAFRELRRADWPQCLADVQRKSLQYSLVRLRATLIARGISRDSNADSRNASPHRCGSTSNRIAEARRHGPDRKCLAAGERNDD